MRKAVLPALFLFSALAASTARADAPGFAINRFNPAERGSDWFVVESLDLRGQLRPAVGLGSDFSYRSLVLYRPDGEVRRSIIRNSVVLHTGASLVLSDRVRF